jgi:DNA-binding MarR family transcriptional regulator
LIIYNNNGTGVPWFLKSYNGHMPVNVANSKPGSYAVSRRNEACTCGSLRKASRRITQFYDTALAPAGIKSTQFSILSEVDRGSLHGPVSMCELATAMVMDRSTLGHNLRPLQRDDLLVLRFAAADRRKRHVELTRKGRSTLRAARRLWKTAEGRFEKIFGKRHAAELRSVLLNIAENDDLNSLPLR